MTKLITFENSVSLQLILCFGGRDKVWDVEEEERQNLKLSNMKYLIFRDDEEETVAAEDPFEGGEEVVMTVQEGSDEDAETQPPEGYEEDFEDSQPLKTPEFLNDYQFTQM